MVIKNIGHRNGQMSHRTQRIPETELHIEVRFQINGEYLPHLTENDVAISYSPGEKTGYLTHAFG